MTNWEQEGEALHNKFCDEATVLATRMFNEVVKPFCDKHKITFSVGMGSYAFAGSEICDWENYGHEWGTFTDDCPEDYPAVWEALHADCGSNDCLFEFLGSFDYDPKASKR